MSTTPMTKIRERVREKLVKAQLIPEVWLGGATEYNLISKICEIFGEELEKLELEIKKLLLPVREKASVGQKRRRQIHNSIINKMLIIIRQHKER